MNRRTILAAGVGAACLAGCTPGAWWHLLRGNGKQPADYPLKAKESQKEIRVLILATSGPAVAQSFEYAGLDRELAHKLGRKLIDETKEAKHPLKPIDPAAFDKFKASTPGWKVTHPSQIAKQLGADYVIALDIASMRLYDPETGRHMYQGAARIDVTVFAAGAEEKVYEYTHQSKMPEQPADEMDLSAFKSKFLDQIVLELSARHTEHTSDSRVSPLKP